MLMVCCPAVAAGEMHLLMTAWLSVVCLNLPCQKLHITKNDNC